ncbi:MAG: Crp/Fnr family transcriptional regulator [Bacteroidetes bacterium]|nr:Crp/Fnr family transcriptional regulator [Bacteroidota bacterium]
MMKRKCENCTHYKCFINKYCSPEWKPLISFNKTTTDYPAGATIFSEGDAVEGIFQIYSGKIKVVTSFNSDKERIIRLANAEELLGHRGLGGKLIYPVTAITLEESQVTFIPIDIFYKAIKANSEFSFQLLMFYADELKNSEKRMKLMSTMAAQEKVAVSILTIINAFGFDANDPTLLDYTPSRKDIASIAGTTYETVIRVLSKLEKSSIIIQEGKAIRVLDLNYFKASL